MPSSCSTNVSLAAGLDPPPAHGLGDAQGVAADDAHGDGVDDPVGVADDDGDERVEARPQRLLLRRRDGAEQHLGIAERLLQRGHRVAAVAVERPEPLGDGVGIGAEPADVLADEVAQGVAEVGRREQRVPGQLVGEHPQPHLVGRDLPVGGEPVDVRRAPA